MAGSLLQHLFQGQPGVQFYPNGIPQGMSVHQAAMGGQQQMPVPPNPQAGQQPLQPPNFGGMAGWFQDWGRQGQGMAPLGGALQGQPLTQPSAPRGWSAGNSFKAQSFGGQGPGRFENHLFGGRF